MSALTATFNPRAFVKMLRELEAMSTGGLEPVLKQKAAGILTNCIKWTKTGRKGVARNKKHLARKFNTFSEAGAGGVDETVAGERFKAATTAAVMLSRTRNGKRIWLRGPDQAFRILARLGKDDKKLVREMQAQRRAALKQATDVTSRNLRGAQGLTAKSWLQVGEAAGIAGMIRGVPAYVRNAKSVTGRVYRNGKAKREGSKNKFTLTLINTQALLANNDQGQKVLSRALKASVSGYRAAVRHGVLDDVKARALRYPGITFRK